MKDKKLAFFSITGELLLEILKGKTDLPIDTQLIMVGEKVDCPIKDEKVREFMNKKYPEGNENVINFIITSKKFWEVGNGYSIPVIDVKSK